jgi:hypothetical protein
MAQLARSVGRETPNLTHLATPALSFLLVELLLFNADFHMRTIVISILAGSL